MRTLILLLMLPSVAFAQAKTSDCYCTDKSGARVELGQLICLQVDGNMFTAKCEMALNNPFWRKQHDGCATSLLQSGPVETLKG